MTAQPEWSPLDDDTADLLSLVADGPMSGHADHEWDTFVEQLESASRYEAGSIILPNTFRRCVRGKVAPRRVGAFTNRALSRGLIAYTGEWQVSDDTSGRNAGKPCRVMRWIGETE